MWHIVQDILKNNFQYKKKIVVSLWIFAKILIFSYEMKEC